MSWRKPRQRSLAHQSESTEELDRNKVHTLRKLIGKLYDNQKMHRSTLIDKGSF